MFIFENPFDIDSDWYLGHKNQSLGCISNKILKCISNFHMLGIQFLFENFIKKRHGAILNQDEDMNMALQVSTFLHSVKEKISLEFPVIIICPIYYICKWHYHISECGFKSHVILCEDVTTFKEFGSYDVYIIPFNSIKLLDQVLKLDLFCVVIDDLDLIASKLIIRKIKGISIFNIGLTRRNFYSNPDQKLKWFMLNWINPGCVGKLNDFYSIDRIHFLAFADNYRYWWMRLTWNFCFSFERPTDEELQDYYEKLKTWGRIHEMEFNFTLEEVKSKRKLLSSEEHSKVKKKRRLMRNNRVPSNSSTNLSSKNSLDACSSQRTDDVITYNQEVTKIEDNKDTQSSLLSPTQERVLDQNAQGNDYSTYVSEENIQMGKDLKPDIPVRCSQSTTIQKISSSDDEEPILSIISSKNQNKAAKLASISVDDINKLTESSESDSEFLSSFVKNKNKPVKNNKSQHISKFLNNTTDEDTNTDNEEFFDKLISGKKNQG